MGSVLEIAAIVRRVSLAMVGVIDKQCCTNQKEEDPVAEGDVVVVIEV